MKKRGYENVNMRAMGFLSKAGACSGPGLATKADMEKHSRAKVKVKVSSDPRTRATHMKLHSSRRNLLCCFRNPLIFLHLWNNGVIQFFRKMTGSFPDDSAQLTSFRKMAEYHTVVTFLIFLVKTAAKTWRTLMDVMEVSATLYKMVRELLHYFIMTSYISKTWINMKSNS